MTGGSLFTGCGGFDLGMEQAGIEIKWQVEKDHSCQKLLRDKWPNVPKYCWDVTDQEEMSKLATVDVIFGGDPCPSRSVAKFGKPSAYPDLSGYFLALVGRLSPRWVVRENVCAPDVGWFAAGLELQGYRTIIIQLDARDFTAQSRRRQFVIGCAGEDATKCRARLFDAASSKGTFDRSNKARSQVFAQSLLKRWSSLDNKETYCYEDGIGLRYLTCKEREALQGFPLGWTSGFSKTRRAIMLGNAVPVPMARWIGERVREVEG